MSVYIVAQLKIHDREQYASYSDGFMEIFVKYDGTLLSVEESPEVLEGDWKPTRLVLLEFPHRRAIREFLDDPEYKPLKELRHQVASSSLVAVDGI